MTTVPLVLSMLLTETIIYNACKHLSTETIDSLGRQLNDKVHILLLFTMYCIKFAYCFASKTLLACNSRRHFQYYLIIIITN